MKLKEKCESVCCFANQFQNVNFAAINRISGKPKRTNPVSETGCSTWNKLINRNHERGGEMHKFGISEWVVVSTKGGGGGKGSEKVALFHIRYNYHDRIQHLSSRAFGAKDRRQGRRNKRGDINFLF